MTISPIETRYKTEMNALFDDQRKLESWMAVEVALARAHAQLGHIPPEAAEEISAATPKVRLSRVEEIEADIHHDLMAMVKALSEQCPRYGGYVHLGATSYDIEDTALACTLREAGGLIRSRLEGLAQVLRRLAIEKRDLVCVGRTHGQHAVPMTYGLKFALYLDGIRRSIKRMDMSIEQISVGKMSGAVGTMATFGDDAFKVQQLVMDELGLKPAPVTSQVIARDRHAQMIFVLGTIAAQVEQIAAEIRNLSRNEIGEVAEGFGKHQVGSSTMPQKRNPHKSERICSLARLVRSHAGVALENVALEHERDLTNSANERFIIPQSFIVCDYMLKQSILVLDGLEFFPERIARNLKLSGGAVLAERVMIALTDAGMGRQDAHELLRVSAIEAAKSGRTLHDVLVKNPEVSRLMAPEKLAALFDERTYIGQAHAIVDAVVGKD